MWLRNAQIQAVVPHCGRNVMGVRRVEVRVTGVVQGVGFRPFIHTEAIRLGLTGHVGNDSAGVFIDVQGPADAIDALLEAAGRGPRMARVESVVVRDLPLTTTTAFVIAPSTEAVGTTSIPPDTAVCDDCLSEMREPDDRRFGYPFIACTNCGPRYTIVTGLPYDRPGTTMADFPLCAACQAEYDDPSSRRFHAQPTACPACGPHLDTPIATIADALSAGHIVALKGIGGYHLACDARDTEAVATLRTRKQRGGKPFALMARDNETARTVVELDETALAALLSPERPIVLAPSLDDALQSLVAPGNGYLGVMLPYAPLHHLLFDAGAPEVLVMTSGNLADEPICVDEAEAEERLSGIADLLVHHNRRIHVACDDSVLRATSGRVQPVRRSRGYAPLPITLPLDAPPLLAVGGELKTTIAVAQGRHAWMSQHIGDTGNLETLAMLARTAATLSELQRVHPTAVVSDAHPGYLSRRWAAEESARLGVDHLTVQHHHAHLAALLAEHRMPSGEPVLGFAFDGTGFGTDGTIWGGELLLGSYEAVARVGHLRPVHLPGGDAAVRRPLRTALAHLEAAGVDVPSGLALVGQAEPNELAVVGRMVRTGAGCTPTTSMGRLFDAVASLLGVRQSVDYEGQAAIELEALAATTPPATVGDWALDVLTPGDSVVLDPTPTVRAAVAAVSTGIPTAHAARAFHEAVAEAVARSARVLRDRTGVSTVGLTGGVFANTVLTQACQGRLGADGFTVLVHRLVPPNDGGLALGQVAVAAAGGASTAEGSA
jgi:hydrogenase maturation protein HypF